MTKYIKSPMIFLLLVFVFPFVLSQQQEVVNRKTVLNVRQIKKNLTHSSLIGKWKLDQDSNFMINKKIEMVNEVVNQRKHNNQKISFFSSSNDIRQAQAFFDSERIGEQPTSLYIQLYDGKYYKNDTVVLQIDLKGMRFTRREDGTLNLWIHNQTIIVVCMLIRNKIPISKISVHASVQIYTNIKENGKDDENSLFFIKFKSHTFSFYVELQHVKQEYNKITWIQVLYTFLFVVSVLGCKPKKSVYNISQWMILQAFAFTLAVGWIFIRLSLEKIDTKLRFMGFLSFVNIVLAFFFLRNYEDVVFNSFKQPYQKGLALLAIFVYFVLCYLFNQSIRFWILQSFCLLVSQINYSYSMGGRGGLSITLVFALLFMRFPYFYYRFKCPQITREPTDENLFSVFLIVNDVLLAFIIIQRYFGSRFMIPKELIPDYFNYFQRYPRDSKELQEVCPICTFQLKKESPLNQSQMKDEESDQEEDIEQSVQPKQQSIAPIVNPQSIVVMITPCNHKYHPVCLQQWMQKRLICPSCRGSLPPSQKQRDDSYCC